MPRKSSIHFKPVSNVRFSVSHSERTDLSEPAYLLPKEHQLGNVVVSGSLSENDLAARFIQQKEGMSRQAKTAGSSPFWEGVLVLSNTNSQEQSANLQAWKVAYEQATGHKVLHMSVHLDEGYMGTDGKPQYNPHSHVIVSRMDSKNRVIHLGRKQLAQVQDLTAEHLKMERGSTLDEREGHRGRKHVPHREFRQQADAKRLELDGVKAVNAEKLDKVIAGRDRYQKLFLADSPIINKLKEDIQIAESEVSKQAARIARLTELKEGYRLDRAKLKASGVATQKEYQALKLKHEADLASLSTTEAQAAKVPDLVEQLRVSQEQGAKVPGLETQVIQQAAEIERLKAEYAEERAALKASGEAKQADYQALKKDLDTALAGLASANAKAAKVPKLEAGAIKAQAEIDRLTPVAAQVPDLEAAFTSQAAQIDRQVAAFDKLKTEALGIIARLREEAKTMKAQISQLTDEKAQLAKNLADPAPRTSQSNPLTPAPMPAVAPLGPNARARLRADQMALEATKQAQEPPKQPQVPAPSTAPVKSLVERLNESWTVMLDWIKGLGVHVPIDTSLAGNHFGPVKHLDNLHAVQHKGGGKYAVHRLADLDKVPELDDPKMVIWYKDGKGTVEGKSGPGVQR